MVSLYNAARTHFEQTTCHALRAAWVQSLRDCSKVVRAAYNNSAQIQKVGNEWQKDKFIAEMILLFSSVEDFDQDVLFTKNL